MVYLKDPLPYMKCWNCDIEVLVDSTDTNLNAGFVLYRATENTVKLSQRRIELGAKMKQNDQRIFNKAIIQMKDNLTISKLKKSEFLSGQAYFTKGNRYFADDYPKCEECVVIHNNWIKSEAAKIYRFKENHLWMYDKDGYYSDSNRKYITYNNPIDFSKKTSEYERKALENALSISRITNRTLILPKFHCKNFKECSLNFKFSLEAFDSVFQNMYREHTFLTHPKVPQRVKDSRSQLLLIPFNISIFISGVDSVVTKLPVKDALKGVDSNELIGLLKPYQSKQVLQFHNLYDGYAGISNEADNIRFQRDIQMALKTTGGKNKH